MADPQPGTERPHQVDDAWSRAVFARRTGEGAAFFLQYLRPGMRLLDCGCGPAPSPSTLPKVTPGEAIGIDLPRGGPDQGRQLACDRGLSNVTFHVATVYQLPCPDAAFDAAFACAVLQHLAAPLGGAHGDVARPEAGEADRHYGWGPRRSPSVSDEPAAGDVGQAPRTGARVPHGLSRRGAPAACPPARGGLHTDPSLGALTTEAGPPAGTLEETRRVAQNHLLQLRGVRGQLALEQGCDPA